MSFLSAQGQTNATSFQIPVLAGGAGTGVADNLITIDAGTFPPGFYLVSFTTAIGGAITSGYIEFQSASADIGQIQLFGAGTYTLTAPTYLSSTDNLVVNASGTGANWTSSASTLILNRLP